MLRGLAPASVEHTSTTAATGEMVRPADEPSETRAPMAMGSTCSAFGRRGQQAEKALRRGKPGAAQQGEQQRQEQSTGQQAEHGPS